MVQGLQAKVPAPAGVWVEAKAKVEAEWVDHLPQGRVEVVSVRAAAPRQPMWPGSLVINERAQNAAYK